MKQPELKVRLFLCLCLLLRLLCYCVTASAMSYPDDKSFCWWSRDICIYFYIRNQFKQCPSSMSFPCQERWWHGKKHVCMFVCVQLQCVCVWLRFCMCVHFRGEQAFGLRGVTALLTYMPLTPPPREKNSRHTRDTASTLYSTHTHWCPWTCTWGHIVYSQIIHLNTCSLYLPLQKVHHLKWNKCCNIKGQQTNCNR